MLLLPLLPILLHLSAASPANAARIRIDIGSNAAPALIFTLNTVKAKPGDVLDFHFIDENIVSSVLKGVATSPCTPAVGAGAFNSGLVLGDPNGTNIFSVNVTSSEQMVVYCGVGAHCQDGMSAVINPSNVTVLPTYAKAAKAVQKAIGPPKMEGGSFVQGTSGGPVIIMLANQPNGTAASMAGAGARPA